MKILVLSFYFEPDLCAGSFRATALVKALASVMPAGSHIDVVTTLPNRYSTFVAKAPKKEFLPGITVSRIALPLHQSGMIDQSRAFLAFSLKVLHHIEDSSYDIVVATSSRLMTAVLGALVARRKEALLYLDIRDIFVDTIQDVLPRSFAWGGTAVFSRLERWAVHRATKINLVSGGFFDYFTSRYPGCSISCFTNGIDEDFIDAASHLPCQRVIKKPLTVLYAGNIGEGQGLHAIIPELAKKMLGRVFFRIIGDGGRKGALSKALIAAGVDNVELLAPLNRSELITAYLGADILFLHLNDYDSFKKVLPSKLFEYAAMGKPVWAGVSGYAADFVQSEIENSAVFHPCDVSEAEEAFSSLKLRDVQRADFIRKYKRKNIMQQMAKDIVNLMVLKK
ncbi:MAG: glycosyltransferase family 4 protein [Desulfobulbaceae bacterium]|nr:glycosyltransferase family 4 protein [Desulfobulbaceae bacterium]